MIILAAQDLLNVMKMDGESLKMSLLPMCGEKKRYNVNDYCINTGGKG